MNDFLLKKNESTCILNIKQTGNQSELNSRSVKPQISLVTMHQYLAKLTCLFITLLALDRFHFTSVVYNKIEFFFLKN